MTANPQHSTYQDLFADDSLDPHGGDYGALMSTFRTANNPTVGSVLRSQVGNADDSYPTAFLGLVEHDADECGRVILLHGVSKFPGVLGRPTSWDGNLYAFVGEVVLGQATTVDFPIDAFSYDRVDGSMQNVPATSARVHELLAQNPDDELLGPFADTEANIRQTRTRRMVPVPQRYVPLLLGRDLTPRACYLSLAPEILANSDEGPCYELLNWITMALMRDGNAQPPSVQQDPLTAPVADATLIKHRREVLMKHLPGLGSGTTGQNPIELVRSVDRVVAEQRLARNEARDRAAAAQLPKGPRSYFGDDVADCLLSMCQAASEADLPPVWHRLAAAGKKDRLALEQAVLAKARDLAMAEQAPIVTPDLTKKVTGLLWAGSSLDDLSEGIQPFSLTLPDYANSDRGVKAQQQAETYDLLTATSSTTTLRDAQSMKATKAVLPTDYLDARAHLSATMLIWSVLVGDAHPFVVALGRLVRQYTSREHFYRNRLAALHVKGSPPTLFLRYVQLRLCNYWREALAYQQVPPDAPDFTAILSKLTFSDSSWVPAIPRRYLEERRPGPGGGTTGGSVASTVASTTASTVASDLTGPTQASGGAPAASAAPAPARRFVDNPTPNTNYDPYREKARTFRVVDAIAKAGPLPAFNRAGRMTPVCIAYHLRNRCSTDCPRDRDHAPHGDEEAAAVVEWFRPDRRRPTGPSTPAPAVQVLTDDLGKFVSLAAARFQASPSWEAFVAQVSGTPDLPPSVKELPHPAGRLLSQYRRAGVPATASTAAWSATRRDQALNRGPHQSARGHSPFVRLEFVDFIRKGYWTVLPYRLVREIRNLRLSPLGVVPQRERRPRLIVDLSFHGVNDETVPLAPKEAMQFGHALRRILQRILDADPSHGPVYLSKLDIADGFYRIRIAPRDVPNLGVLLPREPNEEPLVAFPLVLPMGWVNSPPFFSAATETVADLVNATSRTIPEDLPPHRLEDIALGSHHTSMSDPVPPPPRTEPPYRHQPRMRRPLTYTDVYVDDFVNLVQGSPRRLRLVMRHLLHNLDLVFRPLDHDDNAFRQEPASTKKMEKGDTHWATRKVVLGWIVDTVSGTIELPAHRQARLHEILGAIDPRAKRAGVKKWRQLLGELRSMVLAIPGSRGLFSTLQDALKYDSAGQPRRVRLTKAVHQFLRDFRALAASLATRPTRIPELLPTPPVVRGTTDASGAGMGGVAFLHCREAVHPILWRARFPATVTSQLVSYDNPHGSVTNSDLELAGALVHHDVLTTHCDLRERTVHTSHDNTPTVFWQRKGSASTSGPAAYLLRLQALHQRTHRYVARHDYLPGIHNTMADESRTLDHVAPIHRDAFLGDLRTAQEAVRTGVVPGTQSKTDAHWELWCTFCQELDIDPLLRATCDPIPYLQVFATRYRRRPGRTQQCVRAGTVADALRSVGQTMARLGTADARKDNTGAVDFRLQRQLRSYGRHNPPPHRVKPIPVQVIRHVVATALTPASRAIADMIVLAFFFLLRPGEYTGSNNDDTPFRLADCQLTLGERRLDLFHAPPADLMAATGVSLTFTSQKNGVRGEVVHHGRSGHPHLCPVLAVARQAIHLRHHQAQPATALATYFEHDRRRLVRAKDITDLLRAAAAAQGHLYGFTPDDVSARSLRAGGAMALFNSNVDSNTIRLLGRWQSDAMLRYLHLQAKPVMRGFARRMLVGGDYAFHPHQGLPDVNRVPMH